MQSTKKKRKHRLTFLWVGVEVAKRAGVPK